jgi:hypothetical protein
MEPQIRIVSSVVSQITLKSEAQSSPRSAVVRDYFGADKLPADTKSKISSATKKTAGSAKQKKHVIDKCGPFAAKGREDGGLIMTGGKDGFGIFAKKTEKPPLHEIDENSLTSKTVPVIQSAITHPKSVSANPQNFNAKNFVNKHPSKTKPGTAVQSLVSKSPDPLSRIDSALDQTDLISNFPRNMKLITGDRDSLMLDDGTQTQAYTTSGKNPRFLTQNRQRSDPLHQGA